jgi:hypothetical protein
MEINCEFSNPVRYDGTPPTGNNQVFQFKNVVCYSTTTEDYTLLIQHPTTSQANFLIEKKFDYGNITLNFLLITLIFVLIFKLIHDLVFHKEVRIHSIHQQTF